MAKRKVAWAETAIIQRREILKYWTARNGSSKYAEKLIKLIAERIKTILRNPEAYKKTNFPETRVSSIGHFSILFKITEHNLIITAFWDNRQDPKKLIEILKSTPEIYHNYLTFTAPSHP